MASVAAWLPFARAAAIGWAPLARRKFIIKLIKLNDLNINIYLILRKSFASSTNKAYSSKN